MTDRTLIQPSSSYNPSHERQRNQRIEEVIRRQASNINDQLRALFIPVCTVAQLPAAAAGVRGFVTDATSTTFASVVAGAGANGVPVYFDGTDWRIG